MIVFALLQFSPGLLFEVLMKSHSAVTQNEGSLCQNGKGEEQKIVSPSDCCCCCTSKEPKQQKNSVCRQNIASTFDVHMSTFMDNCSIFCGGLLSLNDTQ